MSFNQTRCKAFSFVSQTFTVGALVASLAAVIAVLVLP